MTGPDLAKGVKLRKGVRGQGESHYFYLYEFRDHHCRSDNKAPRGLILPKDGDIGGESGGVFFSRSGSEDGFESHLRLLNKHVKKGLAIF